MRSINAISPWQSRTVSSDVIMRKAGVLGKPVRHSLSPAMHSAGYRATGLTDWQYTATECDEDGLADLVAGLGPEWAGLSLTMPLKHVALQVADQVDDLAATLGAANTLVRGTGAADWTAYNTDAPGMTDALRSAGVSTVDSVGVLGGGGSARAALSAAADLSRSVTVYVRRPEAGEELRDLAATLGLEFVVASWDRAQDAANHDVVISTAPKGAADGLATAKWRPATVVFDVVYDPWPTALAEAAQRVGCPVVSGLEMLLAQGVRQFELFTGLPAPADAMRAALMAAANAR
jgi:shikimate dehydrogenase